MQKKLSKYEFYSDAYRYVASHLSALAFLALFYVPVNLLPMKLSSPSFGGVFMGKFLFPCLFFCFAASYYYERRILWDKKFFKMLGHLLLAIVLFFSLAYVLFLLLSSVFFPITFGPNFFGELMYKLLPICIFIVCLLIPFFIVTLFALVSIIKGDKFSLISTYSKTRGYLRHFAAMMLMPYLLSNLMSILFFADTSRSVYLSAFFYLLAQTAILFFSCVLCFKMYDFLYSVPQTQSGNRTTNGNAEEVLPGKNIAGSPDAVNNGHMKKETINAATGENGVNRG